MEGSNLKRWGIRIFVLVCLIGIAFLSYRVLIKGDLKFADLIPSSWQKTNKNVQPTGEKLDLSLTKNTPQSLMALALHDPSLLAESAFDPTLIDKARNSDGSFKNQITEELAAKEVSLNKPETISDWLIAKSKYVIEIAKAEYKYNGFCPKAPELIENYTYAPFSQDFALLFPPKWCINFGYGSTWGDINQNRDWYFFSKVKAGFKEEDVYTQFPEYKVPQNDLYFCGPISICGEGFNYSDSIDAPAGSRLPNIDLSQLGYNSVIEPRFSYNVRAFIREGTVTDPSKGKAELSAFQDWAANLAYGAGYRLNLAETTPAARDAVLAKDSSGILKAQYDYIKKQNLPIQPWPPRDRDQDPGIPEIQAYVFDIYLPCTPPNQGDSTAAYWDEKHQKLRENEAMAAPFFTVDQYFGSCTKEFSNLDPNRNLFNFKVGGLDTYWEKTGAKAYIVWRNALEGGKDKTKSRFYEFRTDSPKLAQINCGTQASGQLFSRGVSQANPCQVATVNIFREGLKLLEYDLKEEIKFRTEEDTDPATFIGADDPKVDRAGHACALYFASKIYDNPANNVSEEEKQSLAQIRLEYDKEMRKPDTIGLKFNLSTMSEEDILKLMDQIGNARVFTNDDQRLYMNLYADCIWLVWWLRQQNAVAEVIQSIHFGQSSFLSTPTPVAPRAQQNPVQQPAPQTSCPPEWRCLPTSNFQQF